MTHSLAVLCTALLFGGMTLFSFGFAVILFKALTSATTADARHRFSDAAAYHRHGMAVGGNSVMTMKDTHDR
jgi:hypothetical protein